MRADCTHNNVLWLPETFENIVEGGDYFVVLISSLNAEAEAPEKKATWKIEPKHSAIIDAGSISRNENTTIKLYIASKFATKDLNNKNDDSLVWKPKPRTRYA